jgi:hypothetical protein
VLQRFLGDRALVICPQVVELATRMREAAYFGDARGKQRLVAGVIVAYELAGPPCASR